MKLLWSSFSKLNKFLIPPEREPDIEGILTGKKEKESPDAQKADEALEYMVEEQAVESLNVGKQQKLPDNIGILSMENNCGDLKYRTEDF